MSMNVNVAVARMSREVPNAENSIDEALISVSSLMLTMVQARKETGVPPATGQAAIARLAKAQLSLVAVSSDVLRVHGDLLKLAKEHSGMDIHEKCTDGHLQSDSTSKLIIAA